MYKSPKEKHETRGNAVSDLYSDNIECPLYAWQTTEVPIYMLYFQIYTLVHYKTKLLYESYIKEWWYKIYMYI